MAQFAKRKSVAQRYFERCERLRAAGRQDLIKPNEAYRTAHHRPDDAYRETKKHKGPNATPWKGVKGKEKLTRGPRSPKV